MSKKFVVDTDRAPRAIGPFSQAVGFANLLFVSGMNPQDPHTGEYSHSGIEMQTRRALDNVMGVLLAAGLDASHVVKTTVYLRNMNDYHLMNEAYSSYFDYAPPARTVVEVNRLHRDALISIDAIAAAPVDYSNHAQAAETPLDHPGPEAYEEEEPSEADEGWDELEASTPDAAEETEEKTGSETVDLEDAQGDDEGEEE